jgi:hypothetical protein
VKKWLPIFFLGIFIYNLVGYYPTYILFQSEIHREVAEIIGAGIDRDDLKILKFKITEVNSQSQACKVSWYDEKEFSFDGLMYDIVEQELLNDSVFFYCYADDEESDLLAGLNEHLNTLLSHEKTKTGKAASLKWVYPDMMFSEKSTDCEEADYFSFTANNNSFILKAFLPIFSPPPCNNYIL